MTIVRLVSRGFTLLELLVAISVFSIMALGAYQLLRTVIDSHDRVRETSDGYVALSLAFSTIQRDFNQFTSRPVRDQYGEPLPPIVFDNEDMAIEFTRSGWSNPASLPRSSLQRVAYSIDYDSGELSRHFWRVLDRAEDSEPVSRIILENVEDFRVTGFEADDSEESFSLNDDTPVAPLAVEVTIALGSLGEVSRLFQLVEPSDGQVTTTPGGGEGEQDSDSEAETTPEDDDD